MTSYDSWLESPYQQEGPACPICDAPMIENKRAQSVECEQCGYFNEPDWDAIAEARLEARMEAREHRYDY